MVASTRELECFFLWNSNEVEWVVLAGVDYAVRTLVYCGGDDAALLWCQSLGQQKLYMVLLELTTVASIRSHLTMYLTSQVALSSSYRYE